MRFTVIDVMHNLFLGTAKNMFHLWLERGVLSKENENEIEHKMALFQVPDRNW